MNISYTWLKDFTEFDFSPEELRDLITSRAVTVDDVIKLRSDLKDVIIGKVVEVAPHPDSEHLKITRVDAGGTELVDVVCGAPNVTAGVKYPFAPVGSMLPGNFKIEKRKIRGQHSHGMLCSASELQLGTDSDGIMPLDVDAEPGSPFLDALTVGDTQLVLDVGANRPDMLSHEGVAREVAAATGNELKRPSVASADSVRQAERVEKEGSIGSVNLRVEDTEGCPLYIAVVIRGVKVGPSPEWLVSRLEGAGVRSISNVVDATNYMLLGFGQPMHAFDLNKLEGQSIVVRRAHENEKIKTLDGVERTLKASFTVIADEKDAQAVAGVIGGENSEVGDDTTDILLEVAIFDPQRVRSARRSLGISTDASYRFERAMDAHACEDLARYAASLITSLAGGEVDGAPLLIGGVSADPSPVTLRPSRVEKLLGESVTHPECVSLLRSVGFVTKEYEDGSIEVTPPAWRADVTLEVDLIEEVARLRGYDSFSDELRPFRPSSVPESNSYKVSKRVTEALVASGFLEVRPIPFVADAGSKGVRLLNPMAENEGMLRSDLLSTLARRAEYNLAHMVKNIRLFEVGVAFDSTLTEEGLPTERTVAAALLTGDRFPAHFTDARPPQVDLWDAGYIAEVIGEAAFGRGMVKLEPEENGSGWNVFFEDDLLIGRVVQVELEAPVWASPVYGVEIDITAAFDVRGKPVLYKALPVTPAAEFDLALLVPDSIPAAKVERAIRESTGDLLESLTLFDEFRGRGIESGIRSVAWRLKLRHPDRTLRDKEIEGRRSRILQFLDKELGVRQRIS